MEFYFVVLPAFLQKIQTRCTKITVQINGQETTLQIVDTPAYGSVSIFAPPPPSRPAHLI